MPLQRKTVEIPKGPRTPTETANLFLADGTYEQILDLLFGMAQVFERSPSVFRKIREEEDIRMLLLVPLNGVFESATAETFNGDGKSDILVRKEGKNIFIGECKFWEGPKGFTATIDQLLGYQTWRDFKTAILVFVRDTKMSTVLPQIRPLITSHGNFVREMPAKRQGEFRALMSGRDSGVHFTLTVLCFHIPS